MHGLGLQRDSVSVDRNFASLQERAEFRTGVVFAFGERQRCDGSVRWTAVDGDDEVQAFDVVLSILASVAVDFFAEICVLRSSCDVACLVHRGFANHRERWIVDVRPDFPSDPEDQRNDRELFSGFSDADVVRHDADSTFAELLFALRGTLALDQRQTGSRLVLRDLIQTFGICGLHEVGNDERRFICFDKFC